MDDENTETMRRFPAAMRRFRLHRGLSTVEFANKLGMTIGDIMRAERGCVRDVHTGEYTYDVEATQTAHARRVMAAYELTDAEFKTIGQGLLGCLNPPFPTAEEIDQIRDLIAGKPEGNDNG